MTTRIGRPLPNVTVRERVPVDCFARRGPLFEQQPRRPAAPPPAQVLGPPLLADEEQLFPPEQVLATYALQTPPLEERNETEVKAEVKAEILELQKQQRALERKKAEDARRAQGQLPEAARTAIDEYLANKPDVGSLWIARQVQANPATMVPHLKRGGKPMLKDGKPVPMTVSHLARKITRYREQK
jgi:hypothetical protein